jgi:hypothetical protein
LLKLSLIEKRKKSQRRKKKEKKKTKMESEVAAWMGVWLEPMGALRWSLVIWFSELYRFGMTSRFF